MTSFGLVHCLIALFRILSPVLSISWLCPMINHCFCLFVVAKVYNLSMLLKKLTIVVMTRFAFSTSGHEDGLLYHAIPPYTRSSFGGHVSYSPCHCPSAFLHYLQPLFDQEPHFLIACTLTGMVTYGPMSLVTILVQEFGRYCLVTPF